jgi:hypothetical protein
MTQNVYSKICNIALNKGMCASDLLYVALFLHFSVIQQCRVTNGKERKFHPMKEHNVGKNSRKNKAEKKSQGGPSMFR